MAGSVIITCKKCGMPLKKGTKVCSYCRQDTGYLINRAPKEKKTGVRILGHTIRLPWVTLILVLLNALAGIYKLAGGEYDVLCNFGMYQGALQQGEYGRIILSSFLHLGFPHFIGNMYALLTYGFVFENRIGRWKYLAIYLVSMLGSALLINFVGGNALHAGASGAIWGLMAANLLYCIFTRRKFLYMLYALHAVIGNVFYTFSSHVSWQGHFGGAIAGALIALLLFAKERKESKPIF